MPKSKRRTQNNQLNMYEAEVVQGIEDIAAQELATLQAKNIVSLTGTVQFHFEGNQQALGKLKSVIAVYSLQQYPVPRPKALLGHQHFTRFIQQIRDVIKHHQSEFKTFYIGAAGSQTSIMQRIRDEIQQHTDLQQAEDEGDLLIRIRPNRQTKSWETLVRLTPRPLVTREWRVQDMPGALNASVAYAMNQLSQPKDDDIVCNIGSGSGSLMIERLNHTSAKLIIGCDIDNQALWMSQRNFEAASVSNEIILLQTDGRYLPIQAQSVGRLLADLPFGQLTGSHQENKVLYPKILNEAARIAKLNARFVIITHEIKLMQQTIKQSKAWFLEEEKMINLRGLHPRIYVLVRKDS